MSQECHCFYCIYNLDWRCGKQHRDLFKRSFDYKECSDFTLFPDDMEEEEDDVEIPTTRICPNCDDDAYWDGDSYVCDNCGFVFR